MKSKGFKNSRESRSLFQDEEAGWRIEVDSAGMIRRMMFRHDGTWQPLPFRQDYWAGPRWELDGKHVTLQRVKTNTWRFEGKEGDITCLLKYASLNGRLAIVAGLENRGVGSFRPKFARFILGLDTYMEKYPDWNDRFFPTLLRCEKTHFWGYAMTPKGRILAVASPDPVASWSLAYQKGEHRIYTVCLDLMHTLPLPARHPQNLTELKPSEAKTWTIYLFEVDELDHLKSGLARLIGAPMVAADRYTMGEGEKSAVTIFSPDQVKVRVERPDGTTSTLGVKAQGNDQYTLEFEPDDGFGVYTLSITSAGGKESETKLSLRRPWSWYLKRAREEALHHGQYASSHLEQWLGLHSAMLARRYFPAPELDAKLEERLKTILNLQWNLDRKVPKNIPHAYRFMSNTAQMASVLEDRYRVDNDKKWLELASGFADYVLTCQHPDGY